MRERNKRLIDQIINEEMDAAIRFLIQADQIARLRGDKFGLCDCIDSGGHPFPSQAMSDLIRDALSRGIKPPDRNTKIVEQFSTREQWEKKIK